MGDFARAGDSIAMYALRGLSGHLDPPEPGAHDPYYVASTDPKDHDTIVVDLGCKSMKQIKRLRKGKGKLLDKVKQCIAELRASGTVTGTAQPVVIVIKEKSVVSNMMGMMR